MSEDLSEREIRKLLDRLAEELERGPIHPADVESLRAAAETLRRRKADPGVIEAVESALRTIAATRCCSTCAPGAE